MELKNITEHLWQLELKLLHTDLMLNSNLIDNLISSDFEEINSNGQVSSRIEVVNWLLQRDKNIQWSLTDFRIKELADDVILVIYIAKRHDDPDRVNKGSIRSSIWKHKNQRWKILFHQASKIS